MEQEKGALEGKVSYGKVKQAEYRARQAEAVALLRRLWVLRSRRERGPAWRGSEAMAGWEELAVMLRRMIHEEAMMAGLPAVSGVAPAEGSAAPGGGPPAEGSSTLHTTRKEVGPDNTPNGKPVPKKGNGRRK